MKKNSRVVICGAGIAGVSAAYFLSKAGFEDILLLDERPPLTLTSDRSTECYRNWWPGLEILSLMNRSIDLMEALARESGNVFRMNRRGYVYITADKDGLPTFEKQAARIAQSGGGPLRIHTSPDANYTPAAAEGFLEQPEGADLLLGANVVRHFFPYLTETAVAALHVRRAGWLSAQQLGMYLLEQARKNGVRFRSARLTGVETANKHVEAVMLDSGERIDCEAFVNAAGPYFETVGRMLGLDLPVEAEVHLKLAFEDQMHVVPRDAPLLIWTDPQRLAWEPDERALFESEPTLGWLTDEFPGGAHTRPEGGPDSATVLMLWDYRTEVLEPVFPVPLDDQYPEIVLRGLATMLPGLRAYIGHATRPRLDGGYYVRTRENRPLIGPSSIDGAYLLGAVSGFGIMSACAAGELLAAHVSGSRLPWHAPAFDISRYENEEYVRSLDQMSESGEL